MRDASALYFGTTCYHPWKHSPPSLYFEQAIVYNWWHRESHLQRIYQFKTINLLLRGIFWCNLESGIFLYIPNINTLSILCVIVTKRIPSQDLIGDSPTLVQLIAWHHKTTSHYLNQCWPRSPTLYGITRSQWFKITVFVSSNISKKTAHFLNP